MTAKPARKPDPVARFLWNFATGARASTRPQPRTRTWRAFGARWVGVACVAAVAWSAAGRWQDRGLTADSAAADIAGEYGDILAMLWAGAAAGLFFGGRHLALWWCLRPHRLMWVEPMHPVLYKRCGWAYDADPAAYIHVPEGFQETGIRIRMSPDFPFTSTRKQEVVEAARSKWPLSGMEERWHEKGAHRHVEFKPVERPKLPKLVPFADPAVAAAIKASKDGNPYFGVVAGGKPYRIDLTSETPHMLLAAGTGAGKSDAAKALACQLMHHGAGLIVLDLKRRSQKWAKDLPGVIYCRTIPHMHRVLLALGREIARRSEAADALEGAAEVDQPRILVICEEMTATMGRLRDHWAELRALAGPEERKTMPTKSPAVQAYFDALLMGRAERVNVIAIVQMGTARSLGGPEAREQYGFRGASRFSENARKMLFPTSKIRSSTKPGRWVVVKGDEDSEVQVAYLTDEEAQRIATSGKRSRLTLGKAEATPIDAPVGDGLPHLRAVADAAGLVSLDEASSDRGNGIVDRTLSTLRKDRFERKDQFPRPEGKRGQAHLYDPAKLVEFYVGYHPDLAGDSDGVTAGREGVGA